MVSVQEMMRFPRPRHGRSVRARGVRLEGKSLQILAGTKAMQAIIALEQKGRQ